MSSGGVFPDSRAMCILRPAEITPESQSPTSQRVGHFFLARREREWVIPNHRSSLTPAASPHWPRQSGLWLLTKELDFYERAGQALFQEKKRNMPSGKWTTLATGISHPLLRRRRETVSISYR
jgi:hypothetical protein